MKKIILIGIPGSGKTTLGRQLAKEFKMPFFDTDRLTFDKIKPESIGEFIRIAYNGQFIHMQKSIMKELAKHKGCAIISTGAEVALIPKCASLMKTMGTIIHVKRNPEIILATIKDNGFIKNSEGIRLYMQEYTKYEALADMTLENNGTEEEGLNKLVGITENLV